MLKNIKLDLLQLIIPVAARRIELSYTVESLAACVKSFALEMLS
jgi:hypothetical protein